MAVCASLTIAQAPGGLTGSASGAEAINDLAGYGLGMTLTAFKALPLIDHGKFPQAKALCSGDPELQKSTALGDMWPMPDEARAGMIRCNVFHPDPVNVSWWAPLAPMIGEQQGKAVTYFFVPWDGQTYRLLFSQYRLQASMMQDTRDRLIAHLGNPTRYVAGTDGLNHVAWTDYWQAKDIWVLLDGKTKSRTFTITYVAPAVAASPSGRRFDRKGDILYYSTHQHLR